MLNILFQIALVVKTYIYKVDKILTTLQNNHVKNHAGNVVSNISNMTIKPHGCELR